MNVDVEEGISYLFFWGVKIGIVIMVDSVGVFYKVGYRFIIW